MKVYLAGPITGLTFDDATTWREEFAEELADVGITGYSPLRSKGYLRAFGVIDAGGDRSAYQGVHPLSETAGIVTRDRNDVKTSDLVFVNLLGAERVSIGTVMEIAWADAYRVPTVVAMDRGGAHDHAFIRGMSGFIVYDLETALECIKGVLLP